MVKPKGTVVRMGKHPAHAVTAEIDELNISAWCPDENAEAKPEQVHLVIKLKGAEDLPLAMRFKSPDTLGFLIEELARYRQYVWPGAEPVKLE